MMQWDAPEDVGRLRFSPSGMFLATTRSQDYDWDNDVLRLWDAIRGTELAHLDTLPDINTITFASDRELVIVEDGRCLLWNADSGKTRPVWQDWKDPAWRDAPRFTSGTASPDGGFVALCLKATILVVDMHSGTVRHRLKTPPETEIWYDGLVAAGPFLAGICRASNDAFTYVALWDAERGKRLRTYDLSGEGDVCPLALRPDGAGLAVATGHAIHAFGLETEDELDGFTPLKTHGAYALRYSTDGRTLDVLCRTRQGRAHLVRLDAATGQVLVTHKIRTSFQQPWGAFDPTGDKLALVGGRTIEVLDLADV